MKFFYIILIAIQLILTESDEIAKNLNKEIFDIEEPKLVEISEEHLQEEPAKELVQEVPTEIVQEVPTEIVQEVPVPELIQEVSVPATVQEMPVPELVQEVPVQELVQEMPVPELIQEVHATVQEMSKCNKSIQAGPEPVNQNWSSVIHQTFNNIKSTVKQIQNNTRYQMQKNSYPTKQNRSRHHNIIQNISKQYSDQKEKTPTPNPRTVEFTVWIKNQSNGLFLELNHSNSPRQLPTLHLAAFKPKTQSNPQIFYLMTDGSIQTSMISNNVVDVRGGVNQGADLILQPHHGGPNQTWTMDGSKIKLKDHDLYMTPIDDNAKGAKLVADYNHDSKDQEWQFVTMEEVSSMQNMKQLMSKLNSPSMPNKFMYKVQQHYFKPSNATSTQNVNDHIPLLTQHSSPDYGRHHVARGKLLNKMYINSKRLLRDVYGSASYTLKRHSKEIMIIASFIIIVTIFSIVSFQLQVFWNKKDESKAKLMDENTEDDQEEDVNFNDKNTVKMNIKNEEVDIKM